MKCSLNQVKEIHVQENLVTNEWRDEIYAVSWRILPNVGVTENSLSQANARRIYDGHCRVHPACNAIHLVCNPEHSDRFKLDL